MNWAIFYDDGSSFGSWDGSAFDAPGLGVQVIEMDNREHGRYRQTRQDYYVWQRGEWVGCDLFGLWDYLQQPGPRKVLFGRTLPNAEYEAILCLAEADPRFAPRTAFAFGEQ